MSNYFDGDRIEMYNKPLFVKKFVETLAHRSPEKLAEMVWQLANSRFSDGVYQGKYNPDFD